MGSFLRKLLPFDFLPLLGLSGQQCDPLAATGRYSVLHAIGWGDVSGVRASKISNSEKEDLTY